MTVLTDVVPEAAILEPGLLEMTEIEVKVVEGTESEDETLELAVLVDGMLRDVIMEVCVLATDDGDVLATVLTLVVVRLS